MNSAHKSDHIISSHKKPQCVEKQNYLRQVSKVGIHLTNGTTILNTNILSLSHHCPLTPSPLTPSPPHTISPSHHLPHTIPSHTISLTPSPLTPSPPHHIQEITCRLSSKSYDVSGCGLHAHTHTVVWARFSDSCAFVLFLVTVRYPVYSDKLNQFS